MKHFGQWYWTPLWLGLLLAACSSGDDPVEYGESAPRMGLGSSQQPVAPVEPAPLTPVSPSEVNAFAAGAGEINPIQFARLASLTDDVRSRVRAGNVARAIALLENELRLDPERADAWDLLIELQREHVSDAAAGESCDRLLSGTVQIGFVRAQRQHECAQILRAAGNTERAAYWARMAVQVSGNRLEPLITLTGALLEQGRYAEVVANLEGTLHTVGGGPLEASALNHLGAAYASLGRLTDAVTAYQQALVLAPGRGDILFNLGLAFELAHRDQEAQETFQRLLTIDPWHEGLLDHIQR
jgi:tetratricopeptide (TPR) repeat protein